MATLTVRHSSSDAAELALGVRKAWRRMQQTGAWKRYRKRTGLEMVIAEEVTHGRNGWHPHLHIAALQRTRGELLQERSDWFEQWADAVERELGAAHVPLPDVGLDLMDCFAGEYLAKLGLELADPGAAKGRDVRATKEELETPPGRAVHGKSPLELVYAGELELYMELQLARRKARDITFSRGLKRFRESEPELELASEHVTLTANDFELVKHTRTEQGLLELLNLAENEGLAVAAERIEHMALRR